ncbi:hypothetical protein CAP35_06215 [Chitinophagaceae bacterium IBVUCB1]|nr:hypothetical protein CAP35_06215 [Chitinophagaceae bacterium IBVUCB1]
MLKKIGTHNLLLFLLIILETLLLLHFSKLGYTTLNAVLYSGTSFFIGLLLLVKFYNKSLISTPPTNSKKIYHLYWIIPTMIFIVFTLAQLPSIIQQYKINFTESDIIPTLQLMVYRLFNGEYVYAPYYDFGYKLNLTYLPMTWIPFVIPNVLHIDYRWLAISVWLLCVVLLLIRTSAYSYKHPFVILSTIITLFLFICTNEMSILGYTIEIMFAGYYMLLVMSMNTNSVMFIAITLATCMLSRFSLLLWLPLWATVMFISGSKIKLFKIITLVSAIITILYIIPFLSKDWQIFGNAMKSYTNAAVGEWEHIDKYTCKPAHLYNGVGFAHIFYEKIQNWDTLDKVKRLQKIHFLLCAGITVVMGIWYWFNRKKIDKRIFLMASFKIYLTIFLAFIQVPYIYLMVVANFVSIAIFSEQLRYKTTDA